MRAHSVREFCLGILRSGDLDAKLRPPAGLDDSTPGAALFVARPARAAELRLREGTNALPSAEQLGNAAARARCLRRFANHELMAVELFAWALLRWPDAPRELRRAWLDTLADEQIHTRLYLGRLRAHGAGLAEEPLSGYFWRHVDALDSSPHGPLAFLSAMGLTLEQANLDFTLRYRDGFRAAGDVASARVLQRVHDDEQRHVRSAVAWLRRLKSPGQTDVDAYRTTVPFPLGPARAKGRPFHVLARRRAGLSEALIDYVRCAPARRPARERPGV